MDDLKAGSGVAAVSYLDPDAPALFADSLRRTGFGVIKDHPIPQALVEDIYAEWLGFFDGEAKYGYASGEGLHDGFFSPEVSEIAKVSTAE